MNSRDMTTGQPVSENDGQSPSSYFLIDDATQYILDIILVVCVTSGVAAFGIVTNAINIFVFVKLGLNVGVTSSLFALSCSDFFCELLTCIYGLIPLIDLVGGTEAKVDPKSLQVMFAWTRTMFADISIGITVLIAVDRCLCVVLPLKFRDIVSLGRSLGLIAAVVLFTVASYAPVFATHGLSWQKVDSTNSTKLYVWFSPVRPEIEGYSNIFTSIIVATIYQVVVFVSAVLMHRGLRKSRKFQASAIGQGDETSAVNSQKGRQIVKLVFLVSVILLVCNLPQLLTVYLLLFVDDEIYWDYYKNFVFTLMGISFTFAVINGSVNIFIYYFFNTSYRRVFDDNFRARRIDDSSSKVGSE